MHACGSSTPGGAHAAWQGQVGLCFAGTWAVPLLQRRLMRRVSAVQRLLRMEDRPAGAEVGGTAAARALLQHERTRMLAVSNACQACNGKRQQPACAQEHSAASCQLCSGGSHGVSVCCMRSR